ncbi:allantoicase [Basidiobolus meristosporus CBS 931.73]|uniref:Allantoicase n=1 Tax=Basidiobolus meristosporus CBS 931.73 TaxID=1314790 RepID=A0A1Y1YDT3_9FUNG|nr:allantoicase [Basidiobolus meristosporus CBS 931.73]|eukprot:ORX96201.1 allantoicase [Basidiobolus meristosporus CBS 931.73]
MASYTQLPIDSFKNSPLTNYIDLANSKLGSKVVAVSDEFFAAASNMLNPNPSVREANKFIETGAWFDGWETRRHNPDHDWAIIQLAFAGTVVGFDIDTAHFTGNHAPVASVDVAFVSRETLAKGGEINYEWKEVLPKVELQPTSKHYFLLNNPDNTPYNFVRINQYPDGGIARFRVYGSIVPIFPENKDELVDLAYVGNGARVVVSSNDHFSPASNVILPTRGENMGDGWETKRSRTPGHIDYLIVKLGAPGRLERAIFDTLHFRGNFPAQASLEACNSQEENPDNDPAVSQEGFWTTISPKQKTAADVEHEWDLTPKDKIFTHVRATLYPDGGFKRLRIYGYRL